MDLTSQLRSSLLSQSLPTPSSSFLITLTTARNPPPPIPSLLATAKARLLACDLTNSSGAIIDPTLPSFPPGIDDAIVKETKLRRDIHVQVLDIENINLSRWEQIEELEAIERGERTRGRQVIRVTAEDENESDIPSGRTQTQQQQQQQRANASGTALPTAGSNATHRLVLQDGQGKRIYAVELKRVSRIGVGQTLIGEKILLKTGTAVARGIVLLTPETCVLLGGKIEAWHEIWMEGRLARLKEAVGAHRPR